MPASLSPWPSGDRETEEVETSPNGRYIRYNILLGKGACKRVYKALDTNEGTEVAWNQVELLGMDRDEEARQHLQEEIRVLQKLKHKNIMTFYAWWYDNTHKHINFITELFTSGNLRQYRKKLKIMSENVLKRWAHQILEGLLYLHGHTPPIVHRDLKCDNIFVNSATGEVKIGDLGLATVQQTAMSVVGTPEFMAPEVYDESYDERCDIYSFGMCLLELATLEYPYSECHSVPQIFKKVTLGIPPASLARVSSPELRDFIALCIAHNPADRPSARMLLKHHYLEAVRGQQLSCSDSFGSLAGASSVASVNLAPVGAGNGGSSTGWNTPSGTLHCAASVRDLREALHQQETLARHLMQSHLMNSTNSFTNLAGMGAPSSSSGNLLTLHPSASTGSSLPPPLSPTPVQPHPKTDPGGQLPGLSALNHHEQDPQLQGRGPAVPGGEAGGAAQQQPGPMQRSLTGMAAPPMALAPVLIRSPSVPSVPSPLGRRSPSPLSPANGEAAVVVSPRVSLPSPLGRAAAERSAAAAAGAGSGSGCGSPMGEGGAGDGRATPGSLDSMTDDSDEEVLVPIEMLKAGLLQEGFVDLEAEMFSEVSVAGSDPSALTLVDPTIIAGGRLAPPPRSLSDPRDTRSGAKSRGRRGCRGAAARAPLARGVSSVPDCEPIREGGSDDDDEAEEEEGIEEDEGFEDDWQPEEEAMEQEEQQQQQPPRAEHSIDLSPVAQRLCVRHAHTVTAGGAAAAGAVRATSALRVEPGAGNGAVAEEDEEEGHSGSVDVLPPTLACSRCNSASSSRPQFDRMSYDSSGSGGPVPATGSNGVAGCHSRSGSSDAVVFRIGSAGAASGTVTPALRMSFSGVPPPSASHALPVAVAASPAAAHAGPASSCPPPRNLLVRSATMSECEPWVPLPPLPHSAPQQQPHAPCHYRDPTARFNPGNGPLVPPVDAVRLPSFRNKVLLTQMHVPPLPKAAAADAAATGGGSPVRFLRTTSARTIGGFKLADVPTFGSESAPAASARTWGGCALSCGPRAASTPAANGAGAEARSAPLAALAAVPEGDVGGCGGADGCSSDLLDVAAASASAAAAEGSDGRAANGGNTDTDSDATEATEPEPEPSEVAESASLVESTAAGQGATSLAGAVGEAVAVTAIPSGGDGGEPEYGSLVDRAVTAVATAVTAAVSTVSALARSSEPGSRAPLLGAQPTAGPCGGDAVASGAGSGPAAAASAPVSTPNVTAVSAPVTGTGLVRGASAVDLVHGAGGQVEGAVCGTHVEDLTVVREYARPIQGVIMRLKQFKRLVRDRARALRA